MPNAKSQTALTVWLSIQYCGCGGRTSGYEIRFIFNPDQSVSKRNVTQQIAGKPVVAKDSNDSYFVTRIHATPKGPDLSVTNNESIKWT
jgi:hypothetical protein